MLLLSALILLLPQGAASRITISGSASVEYGGDAVYTCTVDDPTGVVQVTWQKVGRANGGEPAQDLASYSERFGQQVNEPYLGRVGLVAASLSSASITLRNVTWQDEGCYVCTFNAFPRGSAESRTCLSVRGISQVKMDNMTTTAPLTGESELVLSCLATGKPAPTINWNYSDGAQPIEYPMVTTVANTDLTLTASSNITLRVPPRWKGQVACLLNKGEEGQRSEARTFSFQNKSKPNGAGTLPLEYAVLISATAFVIVVLLVIVMVKRMKSKRATLADGHSSLTPEMLLAQT